MSVAQLHVPVGEIDEVAPAFVLGRRECDMQERSPFRPLRFSNQRHVRFARQPVAFARIARNARANHVFPRSGAATVARDDMIKVQVISIKKVSAVLAGILVPLENIVTSKFHFLLRQPVKHQKNNHSRNADLPRNGGNDFMFRRGCRKIAPAIEIVSEKIVRIVR